MTTRRRFLEKAAGIATGLAIGRKLEFLDRTVQAQDIDWWTYTVTNEAGAFLTQFRENVDAGVPANQMNWYGFMSAALAIRSIERDYGLDATLESWYGWDPATAMVDAAYQEGSWDSFHAMAALPYVGLVVENDPAWEQYRSHQLSDLWISGNGPLSTPNEAGWAEYAMRPALFTVPTDPPPGPPEDQAMRIGRRDLHGGLDAATIDTCQCDIFPWYQATSPSLPRVPLESGILWWPLFKADQCRLLNWSIYLAATTAIFVNNSPLGQRYPAAKIAASLIPVILTAANKSFCS